MDEGQPRGSGRAFHALTTALLVFTAVLIASGSVDVYNVDNRFLIGLAMTPLFLLAQYTGFSVRVRGETHAIYPSEALIPCAIAFASPVGVIIARCLAESTYTVLSRRSSVQKLMFNLVLQSLETVVAFAITAALIDVTDINSTTDWLVVGGSVVLVSVGQFFLLSLAIRLATGRGTSGGFRTTLSFSFVTISLGCLIGAIAVWHWQMLVFVVPMLAGSMVLVKDRGRLLRRNDDLGSLERFTRHVAKLARTVEFFEEATGDIQIALDPVSTFLVRFNLDGSVRQVFSDGDTTGIEQRILPNSGLDERWIEPAGSGVSRLVASQLGWAGDDLADIDEMLVVSFQQSGRAGGTIVLVNRGSLRDPFTREQRELLQAMSDQLALSSEVRGLVDDLEHAATHDPLTGLMNRMGLEDAVGEALGVVALADLANFKDVNEALGHEAGNRVLQEVAGRLEELAERNGHIIARYGGDQFALFAPLRSDTSVEELHDQYRAAIGEQILIDNVSFRPLVRIGWLLHSTGVSAAEAIRRAEVALNAAKYELPGTIVEYEAALDSKSAEQLELKNHLVRAIEEERLVMHYQPKLDIKTHLVVGFEALVRWPDGKGGSISPAVFVPIAEQQGEGRRLTEFVLKTSLRQAADWKLAGFDVTININVGVRDLLDDALPNLVGEQLMATGLNPESVVLEITESTMMRDVETVVRTLTRLRELGVGVSVDDFGTGYSSLAYLARLPITELKVDRSFVSKMNDSTQDRFIVTTAVTLGQELGLDVIAEGVEDILDLRVLAEMGCDQAQGFGIGRPMPNEEIIAWSHGTRFKIKGVHDDADWGDDIFRLALDEAASEGVAAGETLSGVRHPE
jgi:diguanylate cyclase (GGDEF)-like protein